MQQLIIYARQRHFQKSHGWGKPWVRWLLLDAFMFAVARYCTLVSPKFRNWCLTVDALFCKQYDWPGSYTADTGLDCWIDAYWDGMSPDEAVASEVDHWCD